MKKIIIVFLALIIATILYGFLINPKGFKIKETKIDIVDLKESFDGLKIAQISDILLGSTKSVDDVKKIVSEVNNLKPDVIVFTGDLISKDYKITEKEIDRLKEEFKKLDPTLYKYAVMGDNDSLNIEIFQDIMKSSDFIILDNESNYLFYKDNTPIKITGITNLDNVEKALQISDDLETNISIVITHYPDYIDTLSNHNINVVLAGHSLQGQIKIPFAGGIMKKTWAKKYLGSYYEVQNTKLYVSSGLGTEKIQFRLFNKPEINLYRLNKAN